MPLVFSYGTLQEPRVQQSSFGRLLRGEPDRLRGFEPSLVPIEDPAFRRESGKTHHANARHTGREDTWVSGTVLELSDAELAAADEYERPAGYTRIAVVLASGKRAWVYVAAGSAPEAP